MKYIALAVVVVACLLPGEAHAQVAPQLVVPNPNGFDPCLDQTKVTTIAINESAASGATQHVALSGSLRIYLCGGGSLQGGAAGTITVRFGTGSACATSPTDVAVVSIVANGDGKVIGPLPNTFRRSSAGQALCTVRSASKTLIGELRYVQE